jgi:two-component system, NarL family, response regulator NreC
MDAALEQGPAGRRRDGGSKDRSAVPTARIALAIAGVPMLSFGFRAAIDAEPDLSVVAEIDEPAALVARLAELAADVAIIEGGSIADGRSTTAAIEAIRASLPQVRLLALEGGGSEPYAIVLRAGADGVLTRDADPADVVAAIRCVLRGETYVSPSLATRMVNTYVLRRGAGATAEDAWDALSDREREVLLLAATGHTNREIAELFHLSEQTIHNVRASVMEKLGFHDRVELLKYAIRRGVISVADL